MHKLVSVLENQMHKFLLGFEIQTDPDHETRTNEKKRTSYLINFAVSADHWVKIKWNRKD